MLKNYYPIEGYRTNLIETEGDTIPLVITLFKADTSSYYKWGLITVTNDNTHKLYKIYYRDGDGKYKGKELYEWDPEIDVATRITELRAGDFIFYKRIWEDLVK